MSPIYRIQDADGRGPYTPGFSRHWSDPEARCLIRAPAFDTYMVEFPEVQAKMEVIMALHGGAFGCGFRTLEQLHRWFTDGELSKLKRFHYSIVTIIPDLVLAESENQLVLWCRNPLRLAAQLLAA